MTVCVKCGVVGSAPLGKPCPACGAPFGLIPGTTPAATVRHGDTLDA